MRGLKILVFLSLVLSLPFAAHAQETPQQKVITVGIVPQQSAARLVELWTPALEYLSSHSGYRLEFKTAKDIPTFEQRLLAGEYDIAYMNPYHYTVFHKVPGYQAFAKEAGRRIQGMLVVRKDSPITDIKQLDGLTVAFPAPAAFAATVLPLAALQNKHITVTPKYVASHDSVYLTVVKGIYPAGGGIMRTLNSVPEEVEKGLRVLWKTEQFTPHAFAARPGLDVNLVAKLLAAMENMTEDVQGKSALADLEFSGIEKAQDKDWDDVRALKIVKLEPLLQATR